MDSTRLRLLEHARSCLVVIDVQAYFLAKLALAEREPLVARITWLMRVARALDIPIVATGEDMARDGPVLPEIAALLAPGRPALDKMVFDLMAQAEIRAAVESVGRSQFVLAGLETDVCVTHSAAGLIQAGYEVAVAIDACASPAPHHEIAIARLRDAGVSVVSAKAVYYDWVRDLTNLAAVKAKVGAPPPGLTL